MSIRNNIFCLIITCIIGFAGCQHQSEKQSTKRFDKMSLKEHYKTKHFNLLILWDQRISEVDDTNMLEKQLREFLQKVLGNNSIRILLSGLDGNPAHFFLTSYGNGLPSDYSSLFYTVDKLNLKKFDRRYNPNISILKSVHELITQFTHKKFFLPDNDFMVVVLSTQDDQNYSINMQGQKYNDNLEMDVQNILKLTESHWTLGKGLEQDFKFSQLRLFVIAPRVSCHNSFSSADRLFYASNQINTEFTKESDSWKREVENFNLCNLNFKNYFDTISHLIDMRY